MAMPVRNKASSSVWSGKIKKQEKVEKYRCLLSKIPDRDVAKLAGVSIWTVRRYRVQQGIPAFRRRKVDWDTILALGKLPDPQIACELGVTRQAVALARKQRNIASHRSSKWDALAAHLGSKPDVVLARELNCSPYTIWYQRTKRGIPPYRHRCLQDISDVELFGTHYRVLAERYGVLWSRVHAERRRRRGPTYRRPNWAIWDYLLESDLSNAAIARKIGCTPEAVGQRRKRYRESHGLSHEVREGKSKSKSRKENTMEVKGQESLQAEAIAFRDHVVQSLIREEPADEREIEAAINRLGALVGADFPRLIWVDSPNEGAEKYEQECDQVKHQIGVIICRSLLPFLPKSQADSPLYKLDESLADSVMSYFQSYFTETLGRLESSLSMLVQSHFRGYFADTLRGLIGRPVILAMPHTIRVETMDTLAKAIVRPLGALWSLPESEKTQLYRVLTSAVLAAFREAPWLSLHSFIAKAGLIEYPAFVRDILEVFQTLVENCFAVWLLPRTAIICQRPKKVILDEGRIVGLVWEP